MKSDRSTHIDIFLSDIYGLVQEQQQQQKKKGEKKLSVYKSEYIINDI